MKTTEYIFLSYFIDSHTPIYGNSQQPKIIQKSSLSKGDTSNTFILELNNHSGTHIDAPYHFINDGKRISEYPLKNLIFSRIAVLDCDVGKDGFISSELLKHFPDKLRDAECILIRTNFGLFRNETVYRTHNPGILSDAIKWLRTKYPSIRCIGIDSISISGYQHREEGRKAHKEAFVENKGMAEPLLLIEDMNLNALSENHILKKIIVIPWQIEGIDSAPCSIVAEVEQRE